MILVQNRQRRLSGNSVWLCILVVCFTVSSCGLFSGGAGDSTAKTKNRTKKSNDGKPMVDTIQWTKLPEDKFPPIRSEKNDTKKEKEVQLGKKELYHVSAIIPFEINRMNMNVEDVNDIRNVKYLQYYAGMQLAVEKLEQEGLKLVLDVYDSKENAEEVRSILENQLNSNTDIIMGPLQKEILIDLARFGKENKIPIISPWYSSQSVANKNPYYIQLTPFLIDHYKAMAQHALASFDADQIYLLGRDGSKDASRFKYFQEEAYAMTGDKEALNEYVIDPDSLTSEHEVFKRVIRQQLNTEEGDKPTVFIIPNFSMRESQYLYDVLRRLNVEKEDKEIYVYGMPVLYNMDKITYDYYTNMNVRIAMSRYTKKSSSYAKDFEANYFRMYNDFPMDDAYEGYDNMMFLGRALLNHGTNFVNKLDEDDEEYLSTKYFIKPVMQQQGDEGSAIDYYENKNLRIIQFIGNEFSIIK